MSISKKDFNTPTKKAALNPYIYKANNKTILENPSLAPGIGTGTGIEYSISEIAKAIAVSKAIFVIVLVSFIII